MTVFFDRRYDFLAFFFLALESRALLRREADAQAILIEYRALLIEFGALFIEYRALLIEYRAHLIEYRALLIEYRALLLEYRALLRREPGFGPGRSKEL